MKDPFQRTKVVIRHLPPSLLLSQIQKLFPGRYNWFNYCPGKTSQKRQQCSRAYLDFKSPEDVFQFSEFFNGHVFVNEKGSQFKVTVEYAPYQRVPKLSAMKDGREGTIYKDPDYLEFLKTIAKPLENLPRPEVNLEMKEAEQSGSMVENPIITPLMEFVRQKRAAETGSQVPLHIRELSKRCATSNSKFSSRATKSSSAKKKHILKISKNQSGNDKSSPIKFSKQEYQPGSSTVQETTDHEKGTTLTTNSGKREIQLRKSWEQEISQTTSQLLGGTSSRSSPASISRGRRQRDGVSKKLIKDIVLSNEARQSQAQKADQLPKSSDNVNLKAGTFVQTDTDSDSSKCGPSSLNSYILRKDDQRIRKDFKGFVTNNEKPETDPKSMGRKDHGVQTFHHTITSQATQENSSSAVSQYNKLLSSDKDIKKDSPFLEKMNMSSLKNDVAGLKMHSSHQERVKKSGSSTFGKGKFSWKRFPSGSVMSQKQVWIQKSSAAS